MSLHALHRRASGRHRRQRARPSRRMPAAAKPLWLSAHPPTQAASLLEHLTRDGTSRRLDLLDAAFRRSPRRVRLRTNGPVDEDGLVVSFDRKSAANSLDAGWRQHVWTRRDSMISLTIFRTVFE